MGIVAAINLSAWSSIAGQISRLAAEVRSSGRPGRSNDPIAAALWMTLSMIMLSGLSASAKYIGQHDVHPLQLVFFRNLFCVVCMLPLLLWRGPDLLLSRCLPLYGVRAFVNVVSMWCWFAALSMMPLAQLQATGFLAPLFATLFAIVYLGERVSLARWCALAVGLGGALVILRPWTGLLGVGQIFALCAAATIGIVGPLVKQLTASDDPDKIVFITNLLLIPMSLAPAIFVWSWPPLDLLPYIVAMGACAFLGHIAMVRAFNSGDASLVATFDFSRLPFAVVVGMLCFGESTDIWTWVGATIIFSAAIFVTRSESRRMKRCTPRGQRDVTDPLWATPLARASAYPST